MEITSSSASAQILQDLTRLPSSLQVASLTVFHSPKVCSQLIEASVVSLSSPVPPTACWLLSIGGLLSVLSHDDKTNRQIKDKAKIINMSFFINVSPSITKSLHHNYIIFSDVFQYLP